MPEMDIQRCQGDWEYVCLAALVTALLASCSLSWLNSYIPDTSAHSLRCLAPYYKANKPQELGMCSESQCQVCVMHGLLVRQKRHDMSLYVYVFFFQQP